MITEAQIKARFRKDHLVKLVERMLKEEFYDYHNHKRDEKPSLLYTLRPGMTPERIAASVRYKELVVVPNGRAAKVYGEYQYPAAHNELKWFASDYLRLRVVPDTQPRKYEIWQYESVPQDSEKIDRWIMSHLLDKDRFVNNNSAIDIYI